MHSKNDNDSSLSPLSSPSSHGGGGVIETVAPAERLGKGGFAAAAAAGADRDVRNFAVVDGFSNSERENASH